MKQKINKDEYSKAAEDVLDMLRRVNFIISKQRLSGAGMDMIKHKAPEGLDEGKTTKSVKRVEFPKEGGIFVFYSDDELPSKGFPCSETVENVDEMKKEGKAIAWGIQRIISGSKLKTFLLFLIFRKQVWEMARAIVESMWALIKRYRSKPIMYCQCVREIYRVFDIAIVREDDQIVRGVIEKIRDIVCMFLEFDDAYRYRFQDVFIELNQEEFNRNPERELIRIMDILISRDTIVPKNKWEMVKKFISLMMVQKRIRKIITNMVREINLKEIAMDEIDNHYSQIKGGYLWPTKREKEN